MGVTAPDVACHADDGEGVDAAQPEHQREETVHLEHTVPMTTSPLLVF